MNIWAILWLGLLVAIYIGTYLLNKKTPKPKGCENILTGCSGCHDVSCSHHDAHKEEEGNNGH